MPHREPTTDQTKDTSKVQRGELMNFISYLQQRGDMKAAVSPKARPWMIAH